MESIIYKYILCFLWSFLLTLFAIPPIINLAYRKRLLDTPNGRTVHESKVPRLGGMAIFAGFVSGVTIFSDFTHEKGIQQLLAGVVLLFFIGLKDDVKPVSAFKKFFVQVICCGIVMFLGGIKINSFYGLLGIYELNLELSYALTFITIIGVTNAINLIDGVNGLAGSIVIIIGSFLSVVLILNGSAYAFLMFSLVGAMIGFLRYNLFQGSIFMGDTGSLVSGFVLVVVAIHSLSFEENGFSPVFVLSVFSWPIIDTIRVMVLRTFKGQSPFSPDQKHIHHIFLRLGWTHPQVVMVVVIVQVMMVLSVWFSRPMDLIVQFGVLAFEALLLLIMVWLFDRKMIKE